MHLCTHIHVDIGYHMHVFHNMAMLYILNEVAHHMYNTH